MRDVHMHVKCEDASSRDFITKDLIIRTEHEEFFPTLRRKRGNAPDNRTSSLEAPLGKDTYCLTPFTSSKGEEPVSYAGTIRNQRLKLGKSWFDTKRFK